MRDWRCKSEDKQGAVEIEPAGPESGGTDRVVIHLAACYDVGTAQVAVDRQVNGVQLKKPDKMLEYLLRARFFFLLLGIFSVQFSIALGNIGYLTALLLCFLVQWKKRSLKIQDAGWNPFRATGLEYALYGLLLAALISVIAPHDVSPWHILNRQTLVIAAYVAAAACPNKWVLKKALYALAAGAFIVSISAAWGWVQCADSFIIDHYFGPGRKVHHLTAGATLLIASCTILGLLATAQKRKQQIFWSVVLAVVSVGLLLSMARGAWVGFSAAMLLCAVIKGPRYIIAPVLLGSLFIMANPVVGNATAREHVMSIINRTGGGDRDIIWRAAIAMFRQRPLAGVGPGGYEYHYLNHVPADYDSCHFSHAHNNVLQKLAERGIIGLAARAGLTLSALLILWNRFKRNTTASDVERGALLGALLAIVAIEGMGLTQYTWGDWEVMLLLWLVVGISLGPGQPARCRSAEASSADSGQGCEPGQPARCRSGQPALFLDRDGTINVENGFCTAPEQLELIPDTLEALKTLAQEYRLFIVTNQSGINRGLLTYQELEQIQQRLDHLLASEDIDVEEVFFCPHKPEEQCRCRKPKTGMLMPWLLDGDIDLQNSWVIGDRPSDIGLAGNLEINSCLVLTGHGKKHRDSEDVIVNTDLIANNLSDFASRILRNRTCVTLLLCFFLLFNLTQSSVEWRNIETLRYRIYRGIFPVGSATFIVEKPVLTEDFTADHLYRLRSIVNTNPLASLLIPMTSRTESLARQEDFSSTAYYEYIYFRRTHYRFFADFASSPGRALIFSVVEDVPRPDSAAHISLDTDRGMLLNRIVNSLPERIHDPLSLLYAFRHQQDRVITTFLDYSPQAVTFINRGQETVSVPAGRFNCVKSEMQLHIRAILPEGSHVELFVTGDDSQIPVMVRYSIPGVGRGTIRLTSYSGEAPWITGT